MFRVPKQQRVDRAAAAAAAFGTARDVVDDAAAAVLGIHRTELRILATLHAAMTLSAGALAGQVGLSPAATTEAVQRLVARGLVTRGTDPDDRRRAVISASGRGSELIDAVYGPLVTEGAAILDRYTEGQLELIADFLERGRRFQMEQAERIRALQPLP